MVYTAVTDGYEVHPVINPRNGWDFVCFAESIVAADGWNVVRIPAHEVVVEHDFVAGDRSKTTKRIKILPHAFLADYDLSIWIDSSLQFKHHVDLDTLCADFEHSPAVLRVRTHPYRRCIYREADQIVSWNLDTRENVGRVIAKYREEGFPENFGLAESGYMLRKHHADAMIAFAEKWWPYVRDWSRRDQLSFNRVLWKNPIAVEWIDDRVAAEVEELSRGRDRGPFFNATFNFFPTRGR